MVFSDYFKAKNYGVLEAIVVLYPILKQYNTFLLSLGDWLLLFAAVGCMLKSQKFYKFRPLIALIVFIVIHEIIIAVGIGGAPAYMINGTIDKILPLILIMMIVPSVDLKKVKTCFYASAAVCMLGLLYHVVQIFAFGNAISPITLPFFDMAVMQNDVYLDQIRLRPVSFFAEPASYAAYMLFPLALCLTENKLKYALVISIVTLLSTSSNGYAQTGVIWLVFLLLNEKVHTRYKIFSIGIIVITLYFVFTSELFSSGIEKIQNIEIENDDRVSAGFYTYMNLPFEDKIFGVMAASPYDYLKSHPDIINGINLSMKGENVYLPMMWFYAIKYGIICVFLVLINVFKGWKYMELKPFVAACLLSLFVQATTLVIPMFIIMLYIYTNKRTKLSYISK